MLTNRAEENKMDRDKNTDTFNSNHATYALLEVGYGHYHNIGIKHDFPRPRFSTSPEGPCEC